LLSSRKAVIDDKCCPQKVAPVFEAAVGENRWRRFSHSQIGPSAFELKAQKQSDCIRMERSTLNQRMSETELTRTSQCKSMGRTIWILCPVCRIHSRKDHVMTKKHLQKRFGSIAVEKGFITTEQLVDALETQARENVEDGQHRLIGQILLAKGYLTESQLDEIIDTINNAMIYTLGVGR
jgi:hypothetical protein